MGKHLEETHLLLESAGPSKQENERIRVKMMEKRSYKFVAHNYSCLKSTGMGKSIRSSPFMVGGHLFTLEFYPSGGDLVSYGKGEVSLFIKNENDIAVDVAVGLQILDQTWTQLHLGYSCFYDREFYKNIVTIEAGERFGYMDFWPKYQIKSGKYVIHDSIIIRATLGVFIDAKVGLPLERCILFQVGYQGYYAEQSVITTQCPAFLSHCHSQSDHIVISDVDNRVFEAMLWFICNQKIHRKDIEAIVDSKRSDPNLFVLNILAAADRFKLKDLRTQCESLISYGEVADAYFTLKSDCKRLWSNGSRLWAKMMNAMSQNMKED